MKKKIAAYLVLSVLAITIIPFFPPVTGGDTVQPMSFWESEWF